MLTQEEMRAREEPWVKLTGVRWEGKNGGSRKGIISQGEIAKDRM